MTATATPTARRHRVALLCRPRLYADALCDALAAHPEVEAVHEVEHVEELLDTEVAIDDVDVAVIALPRDAGLAVIGQPALTPWARGLVSPVPSVTVGWDASLEELVTLVRLAAARLLPLSAGRAPEEGLARLTPREAEILALLCSLGSARDVADALGISAHTVRTHIGRILTKLGLHSRLEAVTYARRVGLSSAGGHKAS